MTHHVVISKAGGATTQEAIAARCPMIVNQVVPGQEEGNYELLRRHHAGALAETPDAVLATLHEAFANHAAGWRRWREALATLTRNDAARDIVSRTLSETKCGRGAPLVPRSISEGGTPLPISTPRPVERHAIRDTSPVATLAKISVTGAPGVPLEPVPVPMRAASDSTPSPSVRAGPSFA